MFGVDLPRRWLRFRRNTLHASGEKRSEGYSPTQYGPACMKALEAIQRDGGCHGVRVGQSSVVDHLLSLDPPVLQDCIWRMVDVPVLLVVVSGAFA